MWLRGYLWLSNVTDLEELKTLVNVYNGFNESKLVASLFQHFGSILWESFYRDIQFQVTQIYNAY